MKFRHLVDKQVVNIIEVCHLLTGDVQVDAGDGSGRMVEEDGEFDQGSFTEFVSPPHLPSEGFPPSVGGDAFSPNSRLGSVDLDLFVDGSELKMDDGVG